MPSELYYPNGIIPTRPNIIKSFGFTGGTSEVTIWTPASGKRIILFGLMYQHYTAATIPFTIIKFTPGGRVYTCYGAQYTIQEFQYNIGLDVAAIDSVLTIQNSIAVNCSYTFYGLEV